MPSATLNTLLDHRQAFLGFVQRRVNDPALAEDILQGAYMRALRHNAVPESGSIVAWFYTVLRHAVIDHYRRSSTESAALASWGREMEDATAPPPELRAEFCACLTKVMDQLTPNYAEVLHAVDLNEQPLGDFARDHNLTPGNAAVRVHRARAALRKQLLRTCGTCAEHACIDCTCRH